MESLYLFTLLVFIVSIESVISQRVATGCAGEADVVFALDSSGFTNERDFDEARDFVRGVVQRLEIRQEKTRVGILALVGSGIYEMTLGQFMDRSIMINFIDTIDYRDGSIDWVEFLNYTQNVVFAESEGGRDVVPNVLVLIASDTAIADSSGYRSRIEDLIESGVSIITYAYGTTIPDGSLDNTMRRWSPDRRTRFVTDRASNLDRDEMSIHEDEDDQVSFMTTLCQEIPSCAGAADITFVLDSSGSVGIDNWRALGRFCQIVVNEMNIAADGVRIAAISYSTKAYMQFGLNTYHTKYDLVEALSRLEFYEGYTNTSGALRLMRQGVYVRSAGDRLSRQDIAIVISDGASTEEKNQLAAEAREVHDYGIRTFGVAIVTGNQRDDFIEEMNTIASDPSSVFELNSFTDLSTIEQRIVSRTCRPAEPVCEKELDVIFMLDASGSVQSDEFLRIINFVRELASRMDIDSGAARVGLLTFSTEPELQFNLDTYSTNNDVTRAITEIVYTRGTTQTHTALEYVRTEMFSILRDNGRQVDRILLIMSDGDSNEPSDTIDQARRLRNDGVDILTIGVGKWVEQPELEAMASFPKTRNTFVVPSYSDLFEISDVMLTTICDLMNECESDPCQNGGTCHDGINMYYCECRSGFTGRDCADSCPHEADVVFLIDSSGSIEPDDFSVMQEFIRDVIFGLNVDAGNRVGALSYATNSSVIFHLNEHDTTRNVQNALNIRYTGGKTNTAEALRLARTVMFQEVNGDRLDMPNIIILLTDGKSNDRDETLLEARECRKHGIHIVVLGVGGSIGRSELSGIATDPDELNLYFVRDFHALRGILPNLLLGICNSEDECDSDPCESGECFDGINMYTCQCDVGFTGRNCDRACTSRADIAFMIDKSGSIQRDNFQHVLSFAKDLVVQMAVAGDDQIQLSIGSFADEAEINLSFGDYSDPEDVYHTLDTLTFDGGETSITNALQLVLRGMFNVENGDRLDVPNYLVLLTDGVPNRDRQGTIPSAIEAHIAGIHVVLLLVGDGLMNGNNYLELHAIASEPYPQNIYNVRRFNVLDGLIPDIASALCNELDECESDPCQNGGSCYDGLYQYVCVCTDRYTGANCERSCTSQIDLAFLVDISGSVEGNYDKEITFMKRIVEGLNYIFRRTKTALVIFDGEAELRFGLDTFASNREILNALSISRRGRQTNIAAGLRMIRDDVFVSRNGDRSGVDNVLITLTDGKANMEKEEVDRVIASMGDCDDPSRLRRYAVGVGESINHAMIDKIACSPTNTYKYTVRTRNEVDQVAERVLRDLCS